MPQYECIYVYMCMMSAHVCSLESSLHMYVCVCVCVWRWTERASSDEKSSSLVQDCRLQVLGSGGDAPPLLSRLSAPKSAQLLKLLNLWMSTERGASQQLMQPLLLPQATHTLSHAQGLRHPLLLLSWNQSCL